MKIVAHCLVKNEEKFIWYAIASVIDYVDEILVWDNGSTDRTKSIIQLINSPKIKFAEMSGQVARVRQKMLEQTQADWTFILDGDEIWSETAIENCKLKILNSRCDVVVAPNYMLIGDVFHYQEEKAGRYHLVGRLGHFNVRAIRLTPGLKVKGIFPNEAYITSRGIKVQNLPSEKILFLETPYLHASFLKKKKYELGIPFARDFYYPEVFFQERPALVPSPWQPAGSFYRFRAGIETPLKKIKRRLA